MIAVTNSRLRESSIASKVAAWVWLKLSVIVERKGREVEDRG